MILIHGEEVRGLCMLQGGALLLLFWQLRVIGADARCRPVAWKMMVHLLDNWGNG